MARSWSDTTLHFGKMRPVASTSWLCTPIGLWHAMAPMIETTRYKPDGRGFDYLRYHWYFSLTLSLRPPSVLGIFPVVRAATAWSWQLYHIHVPIVWKSGRLNLLEPSGPVQAFTPIDVPGNGVMILFVFTDRIRGYSRCSIDGSLTCINTYLNCKSFSAEFAQSRLHYH
jgi:hypothetical protein